MISPQIIDRIFEVAAIEDVVGEYVNLKKAGANFKGLCPFHDDKHPSMSVSPSKGIFKCFSCGQGGNVVHFIMEHEGLSYPLAIRFLAKKYNIPIEEGQIDVDAYEEEARQKDSLFATLEFAKNHFRQKLEESQDGKVIYGPYLRERGLRQDTLEKFQIGLSGLNRNDFFQNALTNGFSPQQLFDSGLLKKVDDQQGVIESNLRDTFIERIVFPIHNISGKILGFGGRIIKSDTKAPKYINSPETSIYEKRKVLYGLYQAKNSIRKSEKCYVVEGYMDVISLSQAGIENVVAVSGTAFTDEQARLIKRFASEVVLLFDGDEAGVNASLKHINTLLRFDVNTRVVLFPADEDPDSYIQKHGKEGFDRYVAEEGKDFIGFIASVKMKGDDAIAKAAAGRMMAERIAEIPDPLKRAAFINEAAQLLGWQERILIDETNKYRIQKLKQGSETESTYVPDFSRYQDQQQPKEDLKNHQEYALLESLIRHADKAYDDDQSIAQFVFTELEMEQMWPETQEVSEILEAAREQLRTEGSLSEQFFIRDPRSSKLAADLLSNRHTLSEGWMKNYDKFVKTDDDNFKNHVVENLNYYKLKRIITAIHQNQEQLKVAESDEEILEIQTKHISLTELKKKITEQIGAVVLK